MLRVCGPSAPEIDSKYGGFQPQMNNSIGCTVRTRRVAVCADCCTKSLRAKGNGQEYWCVPFVCFCACACVIVHEKNPAWPDPVLIYSRDKTVCGLEDGDGASSTETFDCYFNISLIFTWRACLWRLGISRFLCLSDTGCHLYLVLTF